MWDLWLSFQQQHMAKVMGSHSCGYIMIIYMTMYDIYIRHYLAEAERNSSLVTLKKLSIVREPMKRNCRWLLEAENSGPQLTNNKKTDTSVLQFQELNCANKHMSMEKDPTSNKTTVQADTSDCSLWKAGQRTQLICAWINMCFLSHWICYNLVHSNRE